MRKSESEQMAPEELMLESEAEAKPSTYIDLQVAISIIMETVSTNRPVEELMSVAADVAMKYHDGDTAFFFNYDRGMKTAQCTYETHRANPPNLRYRTVVFGRISYTSENDDGCDYRSRCEERICILWQSLVVSSE